MSPYSLELNSPHQPAAHCPRPDNVDLGDLMFSLCYLPTAGRLTITMIKARNLKAMDITGASGSSTDLRIPDHGRSVELEWLRPGQFRHQQVHTPGAPPRSPSVHFTGSLTQRTHSASPEEATTRISDGSVPLLVESRELEWGRPVVGHTTTTLDPYVKVSLMCDGRRLKKRKTSTKRNTLNPVYNEAIVFDVPPESIDQISLLIAVMDYDRVGHNEVIGVCRVGNDAEGLGREHWNEMLTYPRKPIAHWHPLVEVSPLVLGDPSPHRVPISPLSKLTVGGAFSSSSAGAGTSALLSQQKLVKTELKRTRDLSVDELRSRHSHTSSTARSYIAFSADTETLATVLSPVNWRTLEPPKAFLEAKDYPRALRPSITLATVVASSRIESRAPESLRDAVTPFPEPVHRTLSLCMGLLDCFSCMSSGHILFGCSVLLMSVGLEDGIVVEIFTVRRSNVLVQDTSPLIQHRSEIPQECVGRRNI
ncbi:hypothetical protein DNTS_010296 [Danionella cerebrum]|uniref:C2 domain-containing protein n=1 Tax=Danionella cerebrum TaxID=2873325 RepID=A0A553MRD6_9TELE|nr:hypothetical protein DNTS_010296 [Danionella translucida]